MTSFSDFIQQAKDDYHRVEAELKATEQKIRDAGEAADKWTTDQAAKLRADLADAKQKVTNLAERLDREGEEAVADAHDQAKRHWDALHAAVATYREHVAKSVDV